MATVRDCVYGQAVGDALGVPYEGRARDAFACAGMAGFGAHDKPAGTWSDDTSLALALCDSIRVCGRGAQAHSPAVSFAKRSIPARLSFARGR